MVFPRPAAPFLAIAACALLARSARAQDAQTAAAAAAAMTQAGVATGGAPGAQGKNKSGGFDRPLTAPVIQKTTDGAQKQAKVKKSSDAKTTHSKYKSRELTENSDHIYRFNENGEPLGSAPKKKAAAKTKKKTSSASDDKDEKTGACSSDEPCAEKSPDADAL
jgi:hypothetical protein